MKLQENLKQTIIKSGYVDGVDVKVYASMYIENRINDLCKTLSLMTYDETYKDLVEMLHNYVLDFIEIGCCVATVENHGVCKHCGELVPTAQLNDHHHCTGCAMEHSYCDKCGNYEHEDNAYIVKSSDDEYYTLCHDCHYDAMKRGTIKEVNGTWVDSLYIEFCKERESECGF